MQYGVELSCGLGSASANQRFRQTEGHQKVAEQCLKIFRKLLCYNACLRVVLSAPNSDWHYKTLQDGFICSLRKFSYFPIMNFKPPRAYQDVPTFLHEWHK